MAKEKKVTAIAVKNWLVKFYGYTPDMFQFSSNPYMDCISKDGNIGAPDKAKLIKALQAAGFQKSNFDNHKLVLDGVSFQFWGKNRVTFTVPKKAKWISRSLYD